APNGNPRALPRITNRVVDEIADQDAEIVDMSVDRARLGFDGQALPPLGRHRFELVHHDADDLVQVYTLRRVRRLPRVEARRVQQLLGQTRAALNACDQ